MSNETVPAIMLPKGVNPNYLFSLWVGLGRDTDLTVAASGVRRSVIEALIHDFQWEDLAGGVRMQDKAVELQVNRAINYSQAERMRKLLNNAIHALEEDPAELAKHMFKVKAGQDPTQLEVQVEVTCKPLLELSKALQTVHEMSYKALADRNGAGAAPEADESKELERLRKMSLNAAEIFSSAIAQTRNPIKFVHDAKDSVSIET